MASIDAQLVAKEVSENIRKGKKVVLGKIIRKRGYATSTSEAPQRVTQTKSYQDANAPVVKRLVKERDRFIKALENKDLDDETTKDIINSIDTLTKNIQLLTGGKTENTGVGELAEQLNTWINSKK